MVQIWMRGTDLLILGLIVFFFKLFVRDLYFFFEFRCLSAIITSKEHDFDIQTMSRTSVSDPSAS